jgi:hypothetical protein
MEKQLSIEIEYKTVEMEGIMKEGSDENNV